MQGVLQAAKDAKKEAYKRFSTQAEVNAYNGAIDDGLKTWIGSRGIGEQQANESYLVNRIRMTTNPSQTRGLIMHFANEGWINKDQKAFLLQNNTLQEKLKNQNKAFGEAMKPGYEQVDGRLRSLYMEKQKARTGESNTNPENWDPDLLAEYRARLNKFKTFATETYGALNEKTYEERIEIIKEEQKRLLTELDGVIEKTVKGETTDKGSPSQQFKGEEEGAEEKDDGRISIQEYNLLSEDEKENYQPISNTRGRITAYQFKPVVVTPRKYIQELGGLRGRGNDQFNADLKTEVTTTPIYNSEIWGAQLGALEHLAKQSRDGSLNWDRTVRNLSDNRIWGLRNIRNEIDFESIDKILKTTGLTPKEYFLAQGRVQGEALAKEQGLTYDDSTLVALLDKLWLPENQNLSKNISAGEYNKLNKDDKKQYKRLDGRKARYDLIEIEERNDDQAFNISGQEIAQVASVGPPPLPPLPSKEITSQDLSKETHDVTRAETNYRTIYDLAQEIGIKFPEVAAAQFGQESKWGLKESGKNNYWGIKATQQEIDSGQAVYLPTEEYVNGRAIRTYAWFKHFPTIRAALEQYKREWNDDFMDRKGAINANSAEEAIQLIFEGGYATDPAYIESIKVLLREYKDLNKRPEQRESSTISGRSNIA